MAKSVLIIGGNGYIGSRILHDLENHFDFHSIDINWFGNNILSEVKDYRQLTTEEIQKYNAIILLAGHSSVKMCDGPLTSSWTNNVNNFVDLVKKLDKSQTLIYASSGSVYGSQNVITSEDVALEFDPINNYDLTKYALDNEATKFIKEGYNIIGLRFGTVNGWSPNTREELMINSMAKKSIIEKKICVNNKFIKRPILGINDISRAMKAIIDNPISGIYNLASFVDTVHNISSQVSNILGSNIHETMNVAGSYDFIMDTNKFCKTYNFTFNQTVESIVDEITTKFDKTNFTDRNKFIKYG